MKNLRSAKKRSVRADDFPLDWHVLGGTSGAALAKQTAALLGLSSAPIRVEHFPDGELKPQLPGSVADMRVILVQPTPPPVNDNLVELLLSIDALVENGARQVVAVVPYLGYSRQNTRASVGDPVSARVVIDAIQERGAAAIIAVDLHDPALTRLASIPFLNVRVESAMAECIANMLPARRDLVVVAPDEGGRERALVVGAKLGTPTLVLEKERRRADGDARCTSNRPPGDAADGKIAVVVDDMITTGNTLLAAARAVRQIGSSAVAAVCTHGIFCEGAVSQLECADFLSIAVSDSVPIVPSSAVTQAFSVAQLIAEAILKVAEQLE